MFWFLIKKSSEGTQSLIGYIPWFFVSCYNNIGEIFIFLSIVFKNSAQEALRPIGLIPFQISIRIMLMFLKNNLCVKTVVAIIFRQINNKSHFHQNAN